LIIYDKIKQIKTKIKLKVTYEGNFFYCKEFSFDEREKSIEYSTHNLNLSTTSIWPTLTNIKNQNKREGSKTTRNTYTNILRKK